MSEQKPCIRCARQIDAYARVCPYCNWDQTETAPAPEETPPVELYRPPDNQWKKMILAGVGFVALVIIAFVVGSFAHGFDETEAKAAQARNGTTTASAAVNENPTPPKNVTLVPVTGTDATAPVIEQPITSAPSTATSQQPSDTTALPSQQYAAAAARARAQQQQEAQQENPTTDPRALTGAPYREPPPQTAERPPEQAAPGEAPVATSAFPEYKPLPRLSFDHEMTARLTVGVSADGRVTDIQVNEPVPQMGAVIAAVQNWRFRPATINGTPVPARVAVDILFHGNG